MPYPRAVLSIDAYGDTLYAQVMRTPFPTNGPYPPCPFPLAPEHLAVLTQQNAVLARGAAVRNALRSHQGICEVLDAMNTLPLNDIRPLFIMLDDASSQRINWEMLCNTSDQFVALDSRWPIGRIVNQTSAYPIPPSELVTPVRIMVVLSALGIDDQENEWTALRDAVIQGRKIGLEISVNILVGRKDLYDSIRAEVAAGLADVNVEAMPSNASDLTQAIRNWSPHILHFFCHGLSDSNGQQLELATSADHTRHDADPLAVPHGSVTVTTQHLTKLGMTLKNPWLMVLNCCSSGKATQTAPSMAAKVCAAGIPAVVAMMEPVTSADAYRFTRAFYPETLVSILQARTDLNTQASTTLELAPIMYYVRDAIAQSRAGNLPNSPHWSLPVLYVRSVDAQLFVRPLAADNAVRLRTTAQLLIATGAKIPPELADEIVNKILDDIPQDQRPNAQGGFTHG
ncbi:CHAT domain-containing protein [Pseudomonas kairouanensis]|uniref:CHAT domain-containing protein n=1 Tax=Pseudomonas kairouanensis TaxID=2293832 RepID=A0A4Z0AGM1_9PSED|nr:CHAT domain-containing protein [Pseudomonas kairouanensis]TFY85148.1 CHAT domain-containing protein [Pseudomonas kairouanensis]